MTRRKYIVDPETLDLVEVSPDYTSAPRTVGAPVTDLYMDGVRTVGDNIDIGSRKKRREYMRARGLVDADDFRGEWAKAAAQRENPGGNRAAVEARREALARAMHQGRRR